MKPINPEIFFKLSEAENLLNAARNRVAEAVVAIYDAAEMQGDLTVLAVETDKVMAELTSQTNIIHRAAQRVRVEVNRSNRSYNKPATEGGAA